jgi:LysM repeat protein
MTGETLTSIASNHSTTVEAIEMLNPGIKNVNNIFVGEMITLPQSEPSIFVLRPQTIYTLNHEFELIFGIRKLKLQAQSHFQIHAFQVLHMKRKYGVTAPLEFLSPIKQNEVKSMIDHPVSVWDGPINAA